MKPGTLNKKSFFLGVLLTTVVFSSIGALSSQSVLDTFIEFNQRKFRDMNNQYMWGFNSDGSKNAAWFFFEGRIQARTEDVAWLAMYDPATWELVLH